MLILRPWSSAVSVAWAVFACLLLVDVASSASVPADRRSDAVSTSDLVRDAHELTGERTARSRTFRVAKGAYVTRIYGSAVHERGSGGAMRRLGAGLEWSGGSYDFRGDGVSVRVPSALGSGTVRVTSGKGAVGYSLVGAAGGSPAIDGASAVFGDVFEQTEVRLTALADGVKEDIVLAGPGAPSTFIFDLTVPQGAEVQLGERGEIAVDAPGDDDFVIPGECPRICVGMNERDVHVIEQDESSRRWGRA